MDRIESICRELMKIIDDGRTGSPDDACELVYCVVHDSVLSMRRAMAQRRGVASPGEAAEPTIEETRAASPVK
ncbi:MAG: hypothetical protein MUC56_15940 [Thermoanaerobaculales bacterium]|jgi:hypothetical protein|nr:hypothetical protein [Thermoanaerobaculales bacterium]